MSLIDGLCECGCQDLIKQLKFYQKQTRVLTRCIKDRQEVIWELQMELGKRMVDGAERDAAQGFSKSDEELLKLIEEKVNG